MKSSSNRIIEVLESRIAPARIIVAGVPDSTPNANPDTNYTDTIEHYFVNTEDSALDPISAAVGGGLPGVADTFYLRLFAGDRLQVFRQGDGPQDFLIVQSGNLVVFFIDQENDERARDNEVQESEIVGIAAGNGARFELKAALPGDIVYNLDEQGGTTGLANGFDDRLIMSGDMLPGINVNGFTVGSSVGSTILNAGIPERVGGKVIASGNISNLIISGDVGAILAGGAGNNETFDFFPKYLGVGGAIVDTPGGQGVFSFSPAPGKVGSSIKNILVNSVTDRIEAGIGGEGAAGGSMNKIIVRQDSDGFELSAGDGGAAGSVKKNGGKGGAISGVVIAGAVDAIQNDLVQLNAGDGGDSTTGTGGVGGNVSQIFVGYTVLNGKNILSNGILRDNVSITAGAGGDGKVGGKGGSASALDILTSTPEGAGDEISVRAGDGGDSVLPTGGKAGIGGSISSSVLRNVEASIGADIGVRAGDGGSSSGLGTSAAGGSISSLSILGRQIQVEAGDGSDGKVGGKGGNVSNITIENREGVYADAIVFNAGIGGDGNAGNAGAGGNISAIVVTNSDVNVFEINSGIQGNGGASVLGRGGAGGKVTDVKVLDTDANATRGSLTLNVMTLRTGEGGDGEKGGGAGGLLSNLSIVGQNIEPSFLAGDGGSATAKGKGGVGGSISAIEAAISGVVRKLVGGIPSNVSASTFIKSGVGGAGAGIGGGGGAGGNVATVSVNTPGFGSIIAGAGGAVLGTRAAAGRGGSVLLTGVFAGSGEGQLIAGDAGLGGTRPSVGGTIAGTTTSLSGLFAELDLTIRAGNGSAGGAGGSIMNLGYGSTAATLVPTPNGNIIVQAGNGSASPDGKSVGKGGSIVNIGGAVNNANGTTVIRAGDGGSALTKGAAGGSIVGLGLQRGGSLGVEFTIRAGDGGDAPQGKTGANGGSVSGLTIVDVSTDAVFRHIAAGDGGDALKKGGTGGSVSQVNVLGHDIGVRAGELYGFNTMGGIFAGAGGLAEKEGQSGSVTVINADAISAIVAGRGATPKLANKVENIYLNDTKLLKESTGAFLASLPGSQQVFEFTGSLSSTEVAAGTASSGELQSINLAAVRALPPGTQFTLSFQGETTVALSTAATALEIETALNALATVKATGPGDTGTVTLTGTDPAFDITFTQNGDQIGLFGALVDTEQTNPLALTATAAQVQTELNSLPFINAIGGVTVTISLPSGYNITFNNPNDQSQIIGQEVFDVTSTDIQPGVGNTALTVVEATNLAGNETHSFRPIAPFKFSISYTEGAVTETTRQLSADATDAEVQLALEALSTIDPGEVTVTKRLAPTAPDGTFDVKFEDLIDHPALQVVMLADSLTVVEALPGALENIAKETQLIHIDPMGDGLITFSFGVDSFALDLEAGFTLTQLSNQLNLQPSIIAQGGVVVTDLGLNTYQLVFGKAGDQPNINVQEDAFPLGYALVTQQGDVATQEVLRFTSLANTSHEFGYGGQKVGPLSPSPTNGNGGLFFTAAEITAALNSLPGIAAAGGVAVAGRPDNSFQITFNQPGDRTTLNVGQDVTPGFQQYRGIATTIQVGVGDPINIAERQVVESDDTGFFSLTFNGVTSSYLPAGASLLQVQAAVDFLLAGTPDTVVVSGGVNLNSYILEFGQVGPRTQFIVEGLDIVQAVDEKVKGANVLSQHEVQVVQYDGLGEFALNTPVSFTAEEFAKGGDFTFETQTLGLAGIQALPGGQFFLTFQGADTAVLPSNASGAAIEAELDALAPIQAIGGVTVTAFLGGRFDIVFNSLGDKDGVITGVVEGGVSTPLLTSATTLTEIQDALNALPPIAAVGGITVEQPNVGSFNVIYNQLGQMPDLQAFYQVREIQEINFLNAGEFTISFGPNPADTSASLAAGSSPAVVQSALNAIPSIQNAGGVTVSDGLNSNYAIQFNNAGDLPSVTGHQTLDLTNSTIIEGASAVSEVQRIVKTRRFVFDPAKIVEGNFVGAFSDASEIDARTFKWVDSNNNGLYEINEVPLDGLVASKTFNQALVNFTPEARITGGSFTFSATDGTDTVSEIQFLTIKADRFTLVFNGEQTISLPGKASILAVQKALNALATIQATGPGGINGSVTVTSSAPNAFEISFNSPGDRPPIIAPFFYDYNNIF